MIFINNEIIKCSWYIKLLAELMNLYYFEKLSTYKYLDTCTCLTNLPLFVTKFVMAV